MDGLECSEIMLSALDRSARMDAEFYQKKFIEYQKLVKQNGCKMGKLCQFLIGPFGSSYDTGNYVDTPGYRYVRGQDVKPFFLQDDAPRYMARQDFERLKRYALEEGDILISVVGTIGNAAIVQKRELPAIFSCKSTVVRAERTDPYYLIAYLNSKYGRQLLLRRQRGAIQKGLNLDDLKDLEIPHHSPQFARSIREIATASLADLEESRTLYHMAEERLIEGLHFEQRSLSADNTTEKRFSDIAAEGRLDAEYYQPKYDDLFARLHQSPTMDLGSMVDITKSIEPGRAYYGDTGVPFIRVSDLSPMGVRPPSVHIPHDIEPSIERLYPRRDTILFSKDGSVGIAYKVEEDMEAVTSGALLHLRIKEGMDVLPDYLTLVLNSALVRLQAERDASGTVIEHWSLDDIRQIVIPLVPPAVQREIAVRVQESFVLRRSAQQRLDGAVRAVEIAIEQDEMVALSFLHART